jgi:hypothetical protein
MSLRPVISDSKFKNSIIKEFEELSKQNTILYKLLYETASLTNVFLIGGFLRSIANKAKPRDLDVIINMHEDQLKQLISNYSLNGTKNKFGGYKINLNTVKLDIWSVENNWAFKSKLISNYHSEIVNKIAQGTFFNYDSLVFDLRTQQSNFKHYNDCATQNSLDIIRKSSKYKFGNPGKMNNVLRAFQIRNKAGLDFSFVLSEYITKNINNLGLINLDQIVNQLLEEAGKQERFKDIDETLIKESMSHVLHQLNKDRRPGSQFPLF